MQSFRGGMVMGLAAAFAACGPALTESSEPEAARRSQASCSAFAVDDVPVSPTTVNLIDHEIDPIKKRLSCLESGRVIVASIDPATGLVSSPVVVDPSGDAVQSTSRMPYSNGPEWAVSQRGFELYYQKVDVLRRVHLAKAREKADGGWVLESVPSSLWRGVTFASFNPEDPYPRLVYLHSPTAGQVYGLWRDETGVSPAVEHPITGAAFTDILWGSSVWHVPHDRSIVMVKTDALGQQQLARYFLDTGQSTLISAYPPDSGTVNMTGVTEAGAGSTVKNYYIAVVDAARIDVFAEYAGGTYLPVNTLRVPAGETNDLIIDTETITHAGVPYVAFTASASTSSAASTDIWVAPMLAASPCELHKVSAATVNSRVDPQPMTLEAGLAIYYRQKDVPDAGFYLRKAMTGF